MNSAAFRRPGGLTLACLVILLCAAAIAVPATAAAGQAGPTSLANDKHTICHATGSESNPFVVITPSTAGVYHAHIVHQHDEDIIPPFTYKGQTYSNNWDAAGQAIFANGCRPATPPPPTDVCPNLAGNQANVPAGMIKDANGHCVVPPTDVCPNLAGNQANVPAGMIKDANGNCVTPPTDVCPNLAGVQTSVPAGMIKDADGNCVTPPTITPPTDACPNIEGVQDSVPAGMVKDANGNCVTPPVDVCPNIAGVQETVPVGMIKDASGNCVTPPGPPPALVDLAVVKVDTPDPISVGNQLRYTIVVTNLGPGRATGVTMVDPLPTTLRIVSARTSQGSCSVAGLRITCRLGALAVNAKATVRIVARPTASGVVVNTARVFGNEPDPRPANNTSSTPTRIVAPFRPPRAVCDSVTVGRRTVVAGTRATLRIVVKARGRGLAAKRVRIRGAGIDTLARTNRAGVALVRVRATRPGIISITVAGERCGRRIGAIDGGQPDLTG